MLGEGKSREKVALGREISGKSCPGPGADLYRPHGQTDCFFDWCRCAVMQSCKHFSTMRPALLSAKVSPCRVVFCKRCGPTRNTPSSLRSPLSQPRRPLAAGHGAAPGGRSAVGTCSRVSAKRCGDTGGGEGHCRPPSLARPAPSYGSCLFAAGLACGRNLAPWAAAGDLTTGCDVPRYSTRSRARAFSAASISLLTRWG